MYDLQALYIPVYLYSVNQGDYEIHVYKYCQSRGDGAVFKYVHLGLQLGCMNLVTFFTKSPCGKSMNTIDFCYSGGQFVTSFEEERDEAHLTVPAPANIVYQQGTTTDMHRYVTICADLVFAGAGGPK